MYINLYSYIHVDLDIANISFEMYSRTVKCVLGIQYFREIIPHYWCYCSKTSPSTSFKVILRNYSELLICRTTFYWVNTLYLTRMSVRSQFHYKLLILNLIKFLITAKNSNMKDKTHGAEKWRQIWS